MSSLPSEFKSRRASPWLCALAPWWAAKGEPGAATKGRHPRLIKSLRRRVMVSEGEVWFAVIVDIADRDKMFAALIGEPAAVETATAIAQPDRHRVSIITR